MPAASSISVMIVDDQMTIRALVRNGLQQLGFREISEAPDGEAAAYQDLTCTVGARWVKFLWPDHGFAEAETAKRLGLRVMFRAPGEGECHYEDVLKMILALRGNCDAIECVLAKRTNHPARPGECRPARCPE